MYELPLLYLLHSDLLVEWRRNSPRGTLQEAAHSQYHLACRARPHRSLLAASSEPLSKKSTVGAGLCEHLHGNCRADGVTDGSCLGGMDLVVKILAVCNADG